MSEIIVALIALAGTLAGSFGGIIASGRLTSYKIDQLTKRVEKHNKVVDRMFEAEKQLEIHEEKIIVANKRIKNLEGVVK